MVVKDINNLKTVGIVGVAGYTGTELFRLLQFHPYFQVEVVSGNSTAGKRVSQVLPSILTEKDIEVQKFEACKEELNNCDIVFSCLPHGESLKVLREIETKIVDLSSDFRLDTNDDYKVWYKKDHPYLDSVSGEWQYGLCEVFKSDIAKSNKVANPGCFATASSLALAPLASADVIQGAIAISAVSGASGAGKKLSDLFHLPHAMSNVVAYKVGTHQHVGEISKTLSMLGCDYANNIAMTTHVVPMSRGICSTVHVPVKEEFDSNSFYKELYTKFYEGHRFIDVLDSPPHTSHYIGSNRCGLYCNYEQRSGLLVVVSVTDNLIKGAAGQAIQNANIMFGFESDCVGLPISAMYP